MRVVVVGIGKRLDEVGQRLARQLTRLFTSRELQESKARLEEAQRVGVRSSLHARASHRRKRDFDWAQEAGHLASHAERSSASKLRRLLRPRGDALGSGCSGVLPGERLEGDESCVALRRQPVDLHSTGIAEGM
jgi:hypothetical protein